jgi:hypothetical protein
MARVARKVVEFTEGENRALHDATLAMVKDLPSVPIEIRDFMYDVRRDEPRIPHALGRYPEIASVCARAGGIPSNVFAPLHEAQSMIWTRHYQSVLPSLPEAQKRESEAEGVLNVLQLRLAREQRPSVIEETRSAVVRHRDELNLLLAVLDTMYFPKPRVRLIA